MLSRNITKKKQKTALVICILYNHVMKNFCIYWGEKAFLMGDEKLSKNEEKEA